MPDIFVGYGGALVLADDEVIHRFDISANSDTVERIAANYPMCDMLRYTNEDLYRFANRDDINDLEMVEKCGVGIAVANAIDEVKAVADYICDAKDNDGVAKWIEDNIL